MRAGSASGRGRRGASVAFVLVFAILAGGFALGHLTGARYQAATREEPVEERPSRKRPAPGGAIMPPLPPRVEPVTGPNRPPLPAERGGPFGSRFTTGTVEVALTFDDGPDPDWTPPILALLAEYGVKATFCLIGTPPQHAGRAADHPAEPAHQVSPGRTAPGTRRAPGVRSRQTRTPGATVIVART